MRVYTLPYPILDIIINIGPLRNGVESIVARYTHVYALLYVSHITVRDKVRVVKVVRGNSSKRVKGIEIWLMSIFKIF